MRLILIVAGWGIFGGLAWAEVPQAKLGEFRAKVDLVLKRVWGGVFGLVNLMRIRENSGIKIESL